MSVRITTNAVKTPIEHLRMTKNLLRAAASLGSIQMALKSMKTMRMKMTMKTMTTEKKVQAYRPQLKVAVVS